MRNLALLAGLLTSFTFTAFGQTQLIQDGDFESQNISVWTISQNGPSIGADAASAHSGSHYLSMGRIATAQWQTAYQQISIPTNAVSVTLSYYLNIISPGSSVVDQFEVFLLRTDGSVIAPLDVENGGGVQGGYLQSVFDLTPYAGQTVLVAFEALDSVSGSGTIFNVDDVSAILELPGDIPPNDYFTNRTVITNITAVKFGTNYFATKEPGEPNHSNNPGGKSLWWSWTAPTNGILQLNTVGSTFYTLLAAYSANSVTNLTVTNLTKLAANNGANNNDGYARINFPVTAQTEVEIAVDGLNVGGVVDVGAVVLNLTFRPDTNRPTVLISSPAAGAKLTNSTVTVKGTASDNVAVGLVQYRLENATGTNDYQNATGTNQWTAIVSNLVAGANTVRVRAFDTSSNLSLTVARSFTYVLTSPLDLSTTGNGHVSPNYSNALLAIDGTYTLTATPATGSLFSNWTGTITANTPKLTFTMQSNMVLQANFVTNPFTPIKGSYAGLFYDANVVTITNAGFFSAALATAGTFSSKWQFANITYSLSGAFSLLGTYSNAIPRAGKSPLLVQLQLDLAGGETITGSISDGIWTAQVAANRAHYSTANPAPQAGSYTFVIPGSDDSSIGPGGAGVGTVKVSATGGIAFAGVLGDGTAISRSTFISKDGEWPLFAPLYSGKGLLIGWINFDTNQPDTDLSGIVNWIKLPQTAKFYPPGFDFPGGIEAVGSRYKLTNGIPLVNWTDGQIILQGGNLAGGITNGLAISTNNIISGTNKLTLAFTLTSGLFQGSVLDPATGKPVAVHGALLQKQSLGYGYLLGTNQTGSVFLGPQ